METKDKKLEVLAKIMPRLLLNKTITRELEKGNMTIAQHLIMDEIEKEIKREKKEAFRSKIKTVGINTENLKKRSE